MDLHYFHFPPYMLEQAEQCLQIHYDQIKLSISNQREARRLTAELLPRDDLEKLSEESAQLVLEVQKAGRDFLTRDERQTPIPLRTEVQALYICYLPVGTKTDGRIILNWIAVFEDLPDNHPWKGGFLEMAQLMEAEQIAVWPFNCMPHRPFPRGDLPYAFRQIKIPSLGEIRRDIEQTKVERIQLLANYFWNSGYLRAFLGQNEEQGASSAGAL